MSKTGNQYTELQTLATLNSQDQARPPLEYMAVYASIFEPFRFEEFSVLEIGFSRGRGARTLAEYFHRCHIHCLDHEQKIVQPYYDNLPATLKQRISLHQCNQSKEQDLKDFIVGRGRTMFKLIIDDGSHFSADQVKTFDLLWPRLVSGGYYIIEDMHPDYKDGKHNTLEHFKALVDVINLNGDIKTGKVNPTGIDWIMFPFNRIVMRKK